MIGNETALSSPAPGRCDRVGAKRRQWTSFVTDALTRWLNAGTMPDEAVTVATSVFSVFSLLGPRNDEKAGAVHLLRETLLLTS